MTKPPPGIRSSRARRRSRARGAFTLVELMVALTAGLIAIMSIYYVSAASSRHFQEQQRIAQTQMSVRMAMERLRRDIQRAGFLGTPSSAVQASGCQTPPNQLQAIEFFDGQDTGVLPSANTNGATADRIRMTGNYRSANSYLATGTNSTGSRIFLQRTWHSFRSDFGVFGRTSGAFQYDTNRFNEVFESGQVLHIRTTQNQHFFPEITGQNANATSIQIQPSLPIGTGCISGLADGALVAPLSRVEYRVADLTGSGAASALTPVGGGVSSASQDYRGRFPSQLVRRELQFGQPQQVNATAVANSQQVVLEHVAHINYGFVFDDQTTTGNPPTLEYYGGNNAVTEMTNNPHHVRSVLVTLAARTADADPRFPWTSASAGNAADEAPTRYVVNPSYSVDGVQPASRVRSMKFEVFLPNVGNEVIRP